MESLSFVFEGNSKAPGAELLKMHAYRDAIRRSAEAYVIYPGTENETLPMFHELLPGLGAFALRPTQDGQDAGVEAIYSFVNEVVTQVATQTTQHERTRFWETSGLLMSRTWCNPATVVQFGANR